MPSHSPAIRPHSLLSFLLFALLGHYQYPSSNSNNFGPSNSAMALPTSMLNWNTLANNFYPFGQLFRRNNNNNSPIREEPTNSAAMIALVVVKSGPKRNEKTSSEIGQPSLLSTVEEKMPSEIAASLPHSPNRMAAKLPNQQQKFGTLKLCPPGKNQKYIIRIFFFFAGGRSFFEAFELACPMKKRRKRHVMFGGLANRIRAEPLPRYNRRGGGGDLEEENEDSIQNGEGHHLKEEETKSREYRPANISEIMRICCVSGCEFADFFPHCGPFSMW